MIWQFEFTFALNNAASIKATLSSTLYRAKKLVTCKWCCLIPFCYKTAEVNTVEGLYLTIELFLKSNVGLEAQNRGELCGSLKNVLHRSAYQLITDFT